jgi:hypothetical protein
VVTAGGAEPAGLLQLTPKCTEPKGLVKVEWKLHPDIVHQGLRVHVQLYSGLAGTNNTTTATPKPIATFDPQGQGDPTARALNRFKFGAPEDPGGYTVCLMQHDGKRYQSELARSQFRVGVPLSAVSLPVSWWTEDDERACLTGSR